MASGYHLAFRNPSGFLGFGRPWTRSRPDFSAYTAPIRWTRTRRPTLTGWPAGSCFARRRFARRTGIKVRFTSQYAGRPGEGIERAIIAVVQEALMNVHRHSGSKTAHIALGSSEGSLVLTIADQGQWREGAEGVGLASMRERIAEVGGTLSVRATRRGTRLFALVPIQTRPARASKHAA